MFLNALFKMRNIAALLFALGIAYMLNGVIPFPEIFIYGSGAGVYLVFIVQSLLSKSFHEEFNRKEKIRQIQDLNYACLKYANEAKKHTNATYLQKLRKVMEDKKDIVDSFMRGDKSYIKEKIVEQTLNLVIAYTKLLTNFCIRSRELAEMDVSEIANRINFNTRRLNFARDPHVIEDIKNLIDIDQKIISRLKEEKKDLERISAKLDYMESTVNMFKHQILSSIESEEMIEKLETAVNEATALDNVLEERRRNKIRL